LPVNRDTTLNWPKTSCPIVAGRRFASARGTIAQQLCIVYCMFNAHYAPWASAK